ncbi:hypothetical protein CF319_g8305 [Tilletia indica]|nr:hypothetical protein CF319_g8305 [Tilletia indica]
MKARYEKEIISHAGVRFIEPELFTGYDPARKGFTQEIELSHDLGPLEVSGAGADKYKREHGDKVDVWETAPGSDSWLVMLKKGAQAFVPKAVSFERLVAGQIPTGWSGARYGIPEEIVSQVDHTTLWVLVCVAEALAMSGISDPCELYEHDYISEVGISIGSGMGGMQSLSAMLHDRRNDIVVQKDILQETFINVASGWVNLLLMSSSGPIKTPVRGCATALQSVEIAAETILSDKANIMLAGDFDDSSEEGHPSRPAPASYSSVLHGVTDIPPTIGLTGLTSRLPTATLPRVTDVIPTGALPTAAASVVAGATSLVAGATSAVMEVTSAVFAKPPPSPPSLASGLQGFRASGFRLQASGSSSPALQPNYQPFAVRSTAEPRLMNSGLSNG